MTTAFFGRSLLAFVVFFIAITLAAVLIPMLLADAPVLGFVLAVAVASMAVTAILDRGRHGGVTAP